jgi:hypothetical protein
MEKQENSTTVLKIPEILKRVRYEIENSLDYILEGSVSKKQVVESLWQNMIRILEEHNVTDAVVASDLTFGSQVIGETLFVNPENLFTSIVMMGRYIHPDKLEGLTEYEFEDCIIGWDKSGSYVRPKTSVAYIECKMTITKEGMKWDNEKKK